MGRENGFTLIELVIGVTIFIIFVNVLAVSLPDTDKRQLEQAAVALQTDLRYAQRLAVIESTKVEVIFDLKKNIYTVAREADTGSGIDSVKIKTVSFEKNISLEQVNSSGKTVQYTATGTTGDACTITLKSRRYRTDLTVNVGAGRVDIKQIEEL